MTVFRCPHCGAEVSYDPAKGNIKCEYCGSDITVEDYRAYLDEAGLYQVNELACRQCGARILSTDTTVATFCSFCGSSLVLDSRIREEKKPDYIIPFKFQNKKAYNIYRKKIDDTLLAPDWMKDEASEQKLRGIYMPFHIYRFTYDGEYAGEASNTRIEKEKGKKYDVTRTYDIEAPVVVDYDFIPADGASSFPDSISRAVCPYSEKDMIDFDLPYFAGYYADGADVPEDLYAGKMETLVYNDIQAQGTFGIQGLEAKADEIKKNVKLEKSVKTAMFPVWFLSFRNKDRISYAAVNGQTGELVADIPISFRKYLAASLIVAAVISLFLNLFITLSPAALMTGSSILAFAAFVTANRLLNDTYRRKKHFDDAGYTGVDKEPVYEKRPGSGWRIAWSVAGFFLCTLGLLGVFVLVIALGVEADFVLNIMPVAFFLMFIIMGVNAVKRSYGAIKKRKAPIWYKLFTFIKPLLAVAACMYVTAEYPNTDEYAYLAAIFAIIMIILTAFDIVRAQNRFTMRDIPVFTAARGGDE